MGKQDNSQHNSVRVTFFGNINQNIWPSMVISISRCIKKLGLTWPNSRSLLSSCLLGHIQDQGPWTSGSCPYIAGSWLVFVENDLYSKSYLKKGPCPQSQLVKVIWITNLIWDVMITITCRPNIVWSSCIDINARFWATRTVFFRAEGSIECIL